MNYFKLVLLTFQIKRTRLIAKLIPVAIQITVIICQRLAKLLEKKMLFAQYSAMVKILSEAKLIGLGVSSSISLWLYKVLHYSKTWSKPLHILNPYSFGSNITFRHQKDLYYFKTRSCTFSVVKASSGSSPTEGSNRSVFFWPQYPPLLSALGTCSARMLAKLLNKSGLLHVTFSFQLGIVIAGSNNKAGRNRLQICSVDFAKQLITLLGNM